MHKQKPQTDGAKSGTFCSLLREVIISGSWTLDNTKIVKIGPFLVELFKNRISGACFEIQRN